MQDFNSMIASVNSIFTTINSIVSEMADGERYQLKELASMVSDRTGADLENALSFVQYFSHNTDMGYVSRGKKGGFIRGVKQIKPVKEPKQKVSEDISASE